MISARGPAACSLACASNLPPTGTNPQRHDHILVLFPNLFVSPHERSQVGIRDDTPVDEQKRPLRVEQLHLVELTEAITCGSSRRCGRHDLDREATRVSDVGGEPRTDGIHMRAVAAEQDDVACVRERERFECPCEER